VKIFVLNLDSVELHVSFNMKRKESEVEKARDEHFLDALRKIFMKFKKKIKKFKL
jgi:hypothetical protein